MSQFFHSTKHFVHPSISEKTLPKNTTQNGQQNYYITINKSNSRNNQFRNQIDNHYAQNTKKYKHQLSDRKDWFTDRKHQFSDGKNNHLKFGKHQHQSSQPYSDNIYNKKVNLHSSSSRKFQDPMSISLQYQSTINDDNSQSHYQRNKKNKIEELLVNNNRGKQRKGSFCITNKYSKQLETDRQVIDKYKKMKGSCMVEKGDTILDIQKINYKDKLQTWKKQERSLTLSHPENISKNIKQITKYNQASRRTDKFIILKQLGEGTFGKVFLVVEAHTGAIFALKAISKTNLKSKEYSQITIFREIKIQLYLDHPNIVKLYHVFSDIDYIYLLLEVMDGNLYDRLQQKKNFESKQVASNIYPLMKAVHCLHKEKIIHRDLKLQNIMLCNKVIKLGDFGCAIHTMNLRNTKIGSLAYHSPQQLKEDFYNEKVDVWGIGIITFELFYGYTPYDDDIMQILKSGAQTHELSDLTFPQNISIPEEGRNFIMKMLEKDYKKRMNLPQAMIHPFIKANVDLQQYQ